MECASNVCDGLRQQVTCVVKYHMYKVPRKLTKVVALREVAGSNPPRVVYLLIVMKFLISFEPVRTITDEVQTPPVLNFRVN